MPELLKSPSFDLPHSLTAELQLFPDFLEGADLHVSKTKPCTQNELFPGREGLQAAIQVFVQFLLDGRSYGADERAIGNEIT
jgi:hypothetical protein